MIRRPIPHPTIQACPKENNRLRERRSHSPTPILGSALSPRQRRRIRNRSFSYQRFIPATPIPGTCIINIVNLLQRLSNDRLGLTLHRVTSPQRTKEQEAEIGIECCLQGILLHSLCIPVQVLRLSRLLDRRRYRSTSLLMWGCGGRELPRGIMLYLSQPRSYFISSFVIVALLQTSQGD